MDEGQKRGTLHAEPPCNCCGSIEHGLLRHEENINGNMLTKYNCPVALCEDWDDARRLNNPADKYYPCPIKLAKINNYIIHKVRLALDIIQDKGAGAYLKKKNFESLKNQALLACETFQEERQRELAYTVGFASLGLCLCLMILSTMSPIGLQL
jgi:hypothetical protein